jgi:mono/diheme cytochrome c family protein
MKLAPVVTAAVLFFGLVSGQEKESISFSKDIFPIFKTKCLKCHEKDDDNPSSFAMDNYETLMESGKTKNIIVSGNGDESYLITKLLPNPPKGSQMPIFSKKKLSKEDIDRVRQWIDEGAKDN